MKMRQPISIQELAARGPTVDLEAAGRALGIGKSLSYDLLKRGEFPVRVLKLGRRNRVPTADLIALLSAADNADRPPAA